MYQQQVNVINTFRMLLDALSVIAGAYAGFFLVTQFWPLNSDLSGAVFVGSILTFMLINNFVFARMQLYSDKKYDSYLKLLGAITKTVGIDFTILSIGMILSENLYHERQFFILFLGIIYIILIMERSIIRFIYESPSKSRFNLRRILVVGDIDRGKYVVEAMQKQLSWGHEIVGNLTNKKRYGTPRGSLGYIDDLREVLQNNAIDEVIFAINSDPSINLPSFLKICRDMGITSSIIPALWKPGDGNLRVQNLQGIPFLTFRVNNFNTSGLLYKRVLDIIGGIVGLCMLAVIFPVVALAIKRDSEGPVIFKQKRVGQNGRIFELYKFRTMCQDAEARKTELMHVNEMEGAIFKITNDPRITNLGRWLRKTSIDEIPQFINVLKGEMSLVGTRPPTIDEVEQYKDWQHRRISAKPGITGLWQVSGRNEITDFDKIVELDCAYLANWRFLNDIKIILKTIIVVFQRKGAK